MRSTYDRLIGVALGLVIAAVGVGTLPALGLLSASWLVVSVTFAMNGLVLLAIAWRARHWREDEPPSPDV